MRNRDRRAVGAVGAALVAGVAIASVGCFPPQKRAEPPPPRYETLPPKQLPAFLQGTILERMDHINPDPIQVSDFGLVVNLPGTGDTTAPTAVRDYILREMNKRGFGSTQLPDYERLTPDRVLNDPQRRTAIVRVDAFMPPGVRKGQTFDAVVTALSESNTSSLAGGRLYRADLKFGGADPRNPMAVIDVQAQSQGDVFINPALSLNPRTATTQASASRFSRRQGVVMDGAIAVRDQPLVLRMRAPQRSVIRQIQFRVNQHFQGNVAEAKDEAILHLYVPAEYRGDWERFVGVVQNLYLDGTNEVLSSRARTLAQEAVKPDAPLSNISFAWEGMGPVALPAITPLMSATYPEEVQFAAARAAGFIGDAGAQQQLMRIASSPAHRFQVDAVRTLGALRSTPAVTAMLRKLLDSESATVRIEAYKVLARTQALTGFSMVLPKEGRDERFFLDVVEGPRLPIVYATRTGIPRIAVLGQSSRLAIPITFTALDDRLSLSSRPGQEGVTLFYRPLGAVKPVNVRIGTDVAQLVGWLGGAAPDPDQRPDLTYGEIVAILQALADQGRLVSSDSAGVATNFVLQEAASVADEIADAPPIVPRARSQDERIPGLPTTRAVPAEIKAAEEEAKKKKK